MRDQPAQFRLRGVAEGVAAVQAERVRERGYDVLQGYLPGRRVPREELEAWLHGRVEGGPRWQSGGAAGMAFDRTARRIALA